MHVSSLSLESHCPPDTSPACPRGASHTQLSKMKFGSPCPAQPALPSDYQHRFPKSESSRLLSQSNPVHFPRTSLIPASTAAPRPTPRHLPTSWNPHCSLSLATLHIRTSGSHVCWAWGAQSIYSKSEGASWNPREPGGRQGPGKPLKLFDLVPELRIIFACKEQRELCLLFQSKSHRL